MDPPNPFLLTHLKGPHTPCPLGEDSVACLLVWWACRQRRLYPHILFLEFRTHTIQCF